jgi:DNA-binding phage protein
MQKKLKKVDELQTTLNGLNSTIANLVRGLNEAYKSNNGREVDNAIQQLLEYLEQTVTKEHSVYVEMKNYTWQRNHLKIIATICTLMQTLNRMPSNTEISQNAGLSEETIYKHLREFKANELYTHEAQKFQLMVHKVLTTVHNLAVQGDIRACKVFLDYHTPSTNKTKIEQTNYVQINNLKITPTEIEQLPIETLTKIEDLINSPTKIKKGSNRN